MSLAIFPRVGLLATLALCTPLIAFAALDVGVDSSGKEKARDQDACKSGSTEASKGKVTGGGIEYDNKITITKNKVYILCDRAAEGEKGVVDYCDMEGTCLLLSKDSQEGKNILELYDAAQAVAVPYRKGLFEAEPRDILTHMLNDSQMKAIDSMIGKQTFPRFGEVADYSTVLGLAADYSAPRDFDDQYRPKNSYHEAVEQAIEAMAQPASIPVAPNPYSDLPININPSIQRDWTKPNIVDFLTPRQNGELMNELLTRQIYNELAQTQNTLEQQYAPPPVLASTPPPDSEIKSFTPGWFTRTYNSFIKLLFGR